MKWTLTLALIFFGITSQASLNNEISMEYNPTTTVNPAVGTSCEAGQDGRTGDLPAPMFSLQDFTVKNPTESIFHMIAVQIEIKNGASKYTCIIAASELEATGLKIDVPAHSMTKNSCPIKCAGVTLPNKNYSADVTVMGILKAADGTEAPAFADGKLQVINSLN